MTGQPIRTVPPSRVQQASPDLLTMGRRIAETYTNRRLTEKDREHISQAYAELVLRPRILVHHDPVNERVFVVMGTQLWVVDHGVPWCFQLPPHPKGVMGWRMALHDPTPFVTLYEQFGVYEQHGGVGEGPLTLCTSAWFLTSFCMAARTLGMGWIEEDARMAFEQAGLRDSYTSTGAHDLPHLGQKIRMIKGRYKGLSYQLHIIGAGLRPIREAMDREVRRTLWAVGRQDARLAQWLLSAPDERTRLWRSQALRLHRLLLPRLLTLDDESQPGQAWAAFNVDTQALTALIDAGQPYEGEMIRQLSTPTHPWTEQHVR